MLVVILTGPPGAGKTTAARAVATSRPKGVHLHTDDMYDAIVSGFIKPWLPESQAQNETVVDVISITTTTFADGGFDVVLDGIVGPWFLARMADPIVAAGHDVRYVVVRPSAAAARARAEARGDRPDVLDGPVATMYEAFRDLGALEPHVIDTTDLDAEGATQAVLDGLRAGRWRIGEGSASLER